MKHEQPDYWKIGLLTLFRPSYTIHAQNIWSYSNLTLNQDRNSKKATPALVTCIRIKSKSHWRGFFHVFLIFALLYQVELLAL